MAWSHLQSTTKNETSNNSSLSYASACTSGSYLFLAVRYGTTGQTGTASDPTNGTWTRHISFDSNTESISIFGVNNTGTTALAVTLTNTTSTTRRWAILEYQDGSNTLALDGVSTAATGNSTTLLSNAVTPSQSNDLCFCAGCVSGTKTFTGAGGLTVRQDVVNKMAAGDKVIADTSSTTGSYTINGASDPWGCAIVLITSTGGGGGGTTVSSAVLTLLGIQ